ncbi:hypothetical protein IEQ34_020702 [Dendrobium chrysotoxum]|uniref:F-box domain-containing protein n=1 Tax=Dendrobium chrysotoxum TaxID=161865 RepID=A0AAV7G1L6_DENCH|nr:hypothetical protein IEQ34_020702 [Dendrobium chrysotoxum]
MEIHDDGCVLSEDNIYEILTRVCLATLPSCISICKSWRRIASQPCFGEMHSRRTTKTSGFILQSTHDNEYHHTFLSMPDPYSQPLPISSLPPGRPQTIYIEATAPTQSLLFYNIKLESNIKNDINSCYYITRLGTTPYNLPIPSPETCFDTCGVAIIYDTHNIKRTTHEFKLVRISEPRYNLQGGELVNFFVIMEIHDDGCVLSEDNIYEILTRVCLTSLPSCINVCKSWRRIAYQPCFGEVHSHRTTKTSGFILQTTHGNEFHHTFLSMHGSYSQPLPIPSLPHGRPQTIYIEATAPTQSLLFYNIIPESNSKNDINSCYYITRLGAIPYNLPIPSPETCFDTSGVAIICDTQNIKRISHEFKIVRISEPRWGPTTVSCLNYCEIFDSSARKWRRSNDLPSLSLRDKNGIVIKQTAYWIINDIQNPNVEFSSFSIFAFNVEEERGIIITKPETTFTTSNQPYEWRMIPYEEWLILVHMSGDNINVWMMMVTTCDEKIQQWEWKGSYSAEYIKNHKFAFGDGIPDKKVVLLETLYRELWFNLQGGELDMYGRKFLMLLINSFFIYFENFIIKGCPFYFFWEEYLVIIL